MGNLDIGVNVKGNVESYEDAMAKAEESTSDFREEVDQASQDVDRGSIRMALSIAKAGAAVLVAKEAFRLYSAAMGTTEGSADKLEEQMAYLHGTLQGVMFTLFSGDWENLITNIKNTAEATRDLARAEDKLTEAKSRNKLSRGDLEIKLESAKISSAQAEDPKVKKEYLQEAIGYQKQITKLNLSEIQQRIDNQEAYYKKLFAGDDKYWEFVKSNLATIAKNYDVFYSQQEANTKRLSDLNYRASLGPLSESQAKERAGLMMLLALMRDYDRLQGDLSKKGQWDEYLGALSDLSTEAAAGDRAILYLTKQLTATNKVLGKKVKVSTADDIFGAGYWDRQESAAKEYESFMADMATEGGQGIAYWEAQTEAAMAYDEFMANELQQTYANQLAIASEITSVFSDLFRSGMEGWEEFGNTAKNIMKEMMVKVLARHPHG